MLWSFISSFVMILSLLYFSKTDQRINRLCLDLHWLPLSSSNIIFFITKSGSLIDCLPCCDKHEYAVTSFNAMRLGCNFEYYLWYLESRSLACKERSSQGMLLVPFVVVGQYIKCKQISMPTDYFCISPKRRNLLCEFVLLGPDRDFNRLSFKKV